MTLDEAIKHADGVAEENNYENCVECAKEKVGESE